MAVKRNIKPLGPGVLEFGSPGDLLDISCQVTKAQVTWDSSKEDDLPTLCGGAIIGEEMFNAALEFNAGQDTEFNGMTDWTWKNKGKQVPVKFIPNAGEGAQVTGTVTVKPTNFGGDVKKRNISEAEWSFVGEPTFTPDNTPDTADYVPLLTKKFTFPVGTTGGTWTATVDANTTTAMSITDANAIKTAFEALPNLLNPVSVSVNGLVVSVTFGDFVNTLEADGALLTPAAGAITIS